MKDLRNSWAEVFDRSNLRLIPDPPLLVFMERTLKFDIFSGCIDKPARVCSRAFPPTLATTALYRSGLEAV